ncbi:TrmB family transcriptional regulator [Brevibacillus fluminis]|uniref:TrmB family transcriptional regulator n=1 Tax=Brevibacillus fluminis TaxID=511487 RepID=A0A3M8DQR3_9BACL|nr:TrmB family transcriptional regulator [Brevibacillus fluminis]RNB90463.1 TrmB family transcriptional regulator [Brevibacillus fluminis]
MLQTFGFSQYESKVYETLAGSSEPMDAALVVKHSGVPKAKIYEVLSRLIEKGMVLDTVSEKKKLYAALPLPSLIDKLTRQFQQDMEQLAASLTPKRVIDDRVWSLKVDASIRAEIKQMIQQASESIRIMAWSQDFADYLPLLLQKEREGIHIEALVIGSLETGLSNVHLLIPSKEHNGLEKSQLIVADERDMIFAGEEQGQWHAIKTGAQPFVKFFADFFYHDVALSQITQKHYDLLFGDEDIRKMLVRLRY